MASLWNCGADLGPTAYKWSSAPQKSSTLSPVTVSETVESPQGLPTIADVAKPVKAAGIEIIKESRDARVKKAPAEPSELERVALSEKHSVSSLLLSLRGITNKRRSVLAKADWGCAREKAQHCIVRLRVPRQQYSWGEDCAVPLQGGSCLWRGVCISYKQSSR